jgi:hypothetical protein
MVLAVLLTVALGRFAQCGPVAAEEALRDPFVFGPRRATQIRSAGTPSLSGILWDPATPIAVIDGDLVEVGASVLGWQITEIHPDRIVVQRDVRQRTLSPGDPLPSDE